VKAEVAGRPIAALEAQRDDLLVRLIAARTQAETSVSS